MISPAVNWDKIEYFGFKLKTGSTHLARTMMLEDLEDLLSYISNAEAEKTEYIKAIQEENCLGKRSGKTRELTSRHLVSRCGHRNMGRGGEQRLKTALPQGPVVIG